LPHVPPPAVEIAILQKALIESGKEPVHSPDEFDTARAHSAVAAE